MFLIALIVVPFLYYVLRCVLHHIRSPLRLLNGPPTPSVFLGNLIELHDQENTNLFQRWEALYGSTFVYNGLFCGPRLFTTDPIAIAHILQNDHHYPKPDFVRNSLADMGAGYQSILTVEGHDHKRQVLDSLLLPSYHP
jgi:hypothetical protein